MKTFTICFSVLAVCAVAWSLLTSHTSAAPDTTSFALPEAEQIATAPALPATVDFCGEMVPFHRSDVREALDREMIVNKFSHINTILALKRANQYFPMIEAILAQYGVPDDMKYLCVAESNLSPTVKSPSGAVGLWQIMESTGRELGLEINADIDERYNVERSTHAACAFLLSAHEHFGSWTLTAAAYNCGRRRVDTSCEAQKQKSYYDILWNEETSRYVYRIVALKLVLQNPEAYGFHILPEQLYQPESFHLDTLPCPTADLAQYAINKGINYKALKRLNPWLRNTSLTKGKKKLYNIRVAEE